MKKYKNFTDIKTARRWYLFYKNKQEKYNSQQEKLRKILKDKSLFEKFKNEGVSAIHRDDAEMIDNIKDMIFRNRCTLRYLQEIITNINKDIKRLDLESTMVDIARRIKASEETTRKYEEIAKEALVTDKDGNKYYMTEEGRKKIMSKILEVANIINQKSKKNE